MESNPVPLGGDRIAIKADGGNPVHFDVTVHVRPGIILAFHNGALLFEGEIAKAPADLMSRPGVHCVVHPHTKAGLDAAIKKTQRKFKPLEVPTK